jgi:peptidyl-prolyl cis-trans isomerase SurA
MRFGKNVTGGLRITRFFLAALLVSCILPCGLDASPLLDRVVAVVDKEVITWSELYRAMEFEMMSSDMKSASDAEKKKIFKENEMAFLEGMIDRKLQLQAAKKLDIDASKEEIADAIGGIKKKYSMDDKEFQESLKKEGFTFEEYKKRLSEHLILSKLVGQQVRNKIVVSDAEVTKYIAKNKDSEYRVRQIFFKKSERNGDRDALEAKAEEVLQRLKNGEDFSILALRYSEDPTGKIGGDLGYLKREDLGKEFVEVLSRIGVGEVSKPFWTDRGLHIIKLEEKVDGKNMDEFRESVKKKLFEKRFDEEYRNWIRGLRERAFVEVRL